MKVVSIITFTRTIRQSGRSAMVAIPPAIMESLNWELGDKVKISVTEDRAVLLEKMKLKEKENEG